MPRGAEPQDLSMHAPGPDAVHVRVEIRRVLDALAFATDAGDWQAFLAGFTSDATGDYGELAAGPMRDVVEAIRASQARYLGTMNFVGSHLASPAAEGWTAETYVISHHFRRDERGRQWDDHVGTRYLDRFVHGVGAEAGGPLGAWKIAHRVTQVVWFRQDEVGEGGWL